MQAQRKAKSRHGSQRRHSSHARISSGATVECLPETAAKAAERIAEYVASHAMARDERDLDEDFGCESASAESDEDIILTRPLRSALSSIDNSLMTSLWQRGLLPSGVEHYFDMAIFLSITAPAARAAQVTSRLCLADGSSCVLASTLLADAFMIAPPGRVLLDELNETGNDIFRSGRTYDTLCDAFKARARQLAEDPRFFPVIEAARNPKQYLESLAVCEFWDEMGRFDRLNAILIYDLMECDFIRPGGVA